jgi:SAM-dependent methyltransferase
MEMTEQRVFDWENIYKSNKVTDLPWYNLGLDIDLQDALEKMELGSGTFLDLGTGPATQAMRLQELGFEVTGVDISEEAIRQARQTYKDLELIQDDILHTRLTNKFDFILDRGCFHVIDPNQRETYVRNVINLLNDSGLLFLKCFSDQMPETGAGPYRFSRQMIRDIFEPYFSILEIRDTEFLNDKNSGPIKSLFTILKRR